MKRRITILSVLTLSLIVYFAGYTAYGVSTDQSKKQLAERTLVEVSDLKQLQPFSINDSILKPRYILPARTNVMSALRYKEGEVLVKFKKEVSRANIASMTAKRGMSVMKEFKVLSERRGQAYTLIKSDNLKTKDIIQQIQHDPAVEAVSPNYERRISITPNDPFFNNLWGLNNTGQDVPDYGPGTADADIDTPEAWDINTGASNAVVADIDSGVDYTHADLAANMWLNPGEIAGNGIDDDGNGYVDDVHGIDRANYDTDPMDDNGHGTHTAGTMAAVGNNNLGVAGVNWQAKIMALKFINADGAGYDDAAITCIEYAIYEKLYHNVNVVALNASWGGPDDDQVLKDAIEDAGSAGILFCAAAGNDGINNDLTPSYPASYDLPNIIAVAASDHNDQLTAWSNYGATSVDLAAPGDSILSTYPGCSGGDTIFFDDMESGSGNWITGGTNNTWSISTEEYVSPTHAWSDSPGSYYSNNTNSRLELNHDIDLSSYSGTVTFYFYGAFFLEENYDYLFVDISADSGATWVPYGYLTGLIGGWYYIPSDMPNEFKTPHFRLRFWLSTDFILNYDGVYLDDVGLISCQQSNNYAYLPGTSMATPHVTGACALVAAQYPDESVEDRKNRILTAVDPKPALTGKVLTGGRLNVYNAFSFDSCPNDPNKTDPGVCGCGVADIDSESDGVTDCIDNCPTIGNADQQDSYPPLGNGIGDACECEGNFNCAEDQDVDGSDAFTFKSDFGRSIVLHPCIAGDTCNGDFSCDGDVDGTDAFLFKSDFGRSIILNPCPYCVTNPWCTYQ